MLFKMYIIKYMNLLQCQELYPFTLLRRLYLNCKTKVGMQD